MGCGSSILVNKTNRIIPFEQKRLYNLKPITITTTPPSERPIHIVRTDQWDTTQFEDRFVQVKQQQMQFLHQEQQNIRLNTGREIRPEEIELGPKIGEGQSARVYKATCRGKPVAVKVFCIDKCDELFIEYFKSEVSAMSKINHPNICLYMGGCTAVDAKMMIITPLYTTGLDKLIFATHVPVSLSLRMRIAMDIAMGMNWLHSTTPKIMHSDLKTSNILLDNNYNAVVGDFGQAHIFGKTAQYTNKWCGTLLYMAPEKLQGLAYTESVDIYAFGLILCEIVNRQRVYPKYSHSSTTTAAEFIGAVCERHELPVVQDCPASLASLIDACLQFTPEIRPSFRRIVDSLEAIISEVTIPDAIGRKFWIDHYGQLNQVRWKLFKPHFSQFVNRPSLFWLKPLVTKRVASTETILDIISNTDIPTVSTPKLTDDLSNCVSTTHELVVQWNNLGAF